MKAGFDRVKTELVQVAVERDILQTRLKKVMAEVETAQGKATSARDKILAYQAQDALLLPQVVTDRDTLQGRVKELTSEVETLRAAAQDYIVAWQEHKRLWAQAVAERDSLHGQLTEAKAEIEALQKRKQATPARG